MNINKMITNNSDNSDNNLDTFIDQIDNNTKIHTCCKCLCFSNHLLEMSCNDFICLECCENMINENNYKNCPNCNTFLTKNIHKIFSDFMTNPLIKLEYYHDISIDDMVWAYGGNGHNWLYSKENCNQIEAAYKLFESNNNSDQISTIDIQIKMGNKTETYQLDFNEMEQYPKNNRNKSRIITSFKLKSINDLKKNKIIGVAGKLL